MYILNNAWSTSSDVFRFWKCWEVDIHIFSSFFFWSLYGDCIKRPPVICDLFIKVPWRVTCDSLDCKIKAVTSKQNWECPYIKSTEVADCTKIPLCGITAKENLWTPMSAFSSGALEDRNLQHKMSSLWTNIKSHAHHTFHCTDLTEIN